MEMGSRDKGLSASNVVIETKEPSITYGIIFSTKKITRINLQVEQNYNCYFSDFGSQLE